MSYRDDDRYEGSRDRRGPRGPSGDRDGPGGLLIFLVLLSRQQAIHFISSQLSVINHLTRGCSSLYLRFQWYR